jgi:hypothetical protein
VELGIGSTVKLSEDFEVWRQAFDQQRRQSLVTYPGKLGEMINQSFVRDGFIGVMASDKMGKSFFLLDLAVRAVKRNRRVAYFECGDLGRDEVILRLGQRVAMKPLNRQMVRWPVDGEWELNIPPYEERLCGPLTAAEAFGHWRRLTQEKDVLRLSCHLNSSISVDGIQSVLEQWEREGFTPDAVIVDYSDILAPPNGVKESLDQTDVTWKKLRQTAQRWHCLVATATQANAEAYRQKGPLRRRNFGQRKTKLAHVTGMLAISRDEDDMENGVSKIGWVVGRSWKWREGSTVSVAGCWECCCPFLRSWEGGSE